MALRREQKMHYLRRIPLFSHCSSRELGRIASLTTQIPMTEGTVLTREGRYGYEFFVLIDGTAEVRRNGSVINTLHAGDFFGEIALVSDQPRTATVAATAAGSVLVLSEREFRSLMEAFPSIQNKVLRALADRVAVDDQRLNLPT
jgi:CRP/FNR family transcriptional regulator, cyclic AMP receptor protein